MGLDQRYAEVPATSILRSAFHHQESNLALPATLATRTVVKRKAALALALILPMPTIGIAAPAFWFPESALGQTIFVATKLWVALFPVCWFYFVDRGRLSASPARKGGFAAASLLGAVIALAIVAAYFLIQRWDWIDPQFVVDHAIAVGLNNRGVYLVGALYWITLNSLMEEYVWRWFVFRKFEILFGGRMAVVASALGFTLHHVVALSNYFDWGLTLICSLGVFIGGTVWSLLYLRYQSVWPCYVSHAIVDVPIFVIGYFLIFG